MGSPRALDLFCGAGGASMGLHLAGYDVTGVDLSPQPNYPFAFVQGDATAVDVAGYDFVWASPPCQAFTAYRRKSRETIGATALNLIPATRERLRGQSAPYVIENVMGAPLIDPVMLCGSMFGLDVQRHRIFETSRPVLGPSCNHSQWTARFAPATNRANLRKTVEVGVWRIPLDVQSKAMGIDWMTREELSQAIPPSYARWLADAVGNVAAEAA